MQNVVTYDTVIDFENPEEQLLPGETAYVTIPTGHASQVLKIPSAALRFAPEMPPDQLQALYKQNNIPMAATTTHLGGWQVVWKLEGEKKVVPVAIRAGVTDYSFTQMMQGDLKEGDVLVTDEESSQAQGSSSQFPGSPRMGRKR